MAFSDGLRAAIKRKNLVVKEVAAALSISKRTIDSYLESDPREPAAETSVKLAMFLGTTVEELVAGDEGRDYVADLARRNGWQSTAPPPRIEAIMADVMDLSDDCFLAIKETIHNMAERERAKATGEHPKASNH